MSDQSNVEVMADRAVETVEALAGAFVTAVEVVAERVELATQVAETRIRTATLASVLESIAEQRTVARGRMGSASPALRRLLEFQVETLGAQEVAILETAGVSEPDAKKALTVADGNNSVPAPGKKGRRRN
jgi:hypothetical protein